MAFREEQRIGPYRLIEMIGRGGFGEVWLAEKRSALVSKRVAVKLPLEVQVDFEAIQQEAELWEKASGHPNVLPLIDADIYDGQVVIVSEYADGGSLAERLGRGPVPVATAVEKTIGILNGLEYLHSKQIIHRDIKPQNILLQGSTPRLADFGISRAMNTDTISSVVAGTDAYMAPEAFDGERNVQTDVWSVGVVLYRMLKGSLPYPQQHPTERMFAILTKEHEPLGEEIPADLRRTVARALARKPAERYRTAAGMRDELRTALAALHHREAEPARRTEVLPERGQQQQQRTEVIPTAVTEERTEVMTEAGMLVRDTSPAHPAVPPAARPPAPSPESPPARPSRRRGKIAGLLFGGILLFVLLGLGTAGLGGAYYYYYVYLPGLEEEEIVGVRPSVPYKVGDIAREHIAPHANITFTDSRGRQVVLERGEIIVKKGELITPEIFEKVSAVYNYNDMSEEP